MGVKMKNKTGLVTITLFLSAFIIFSLSCYKEKPTAVVLPTVKAEGEIRPPKLIKEVKPVYPIIARNKGVEGTVTLQVITDIYGKVKNVKVLESIPLLDQAAIDAVRQWVFEPLVIDGKPRRTMFKVWVTFKVK
jgi:TonB family protein